MAIAFRLSGVPENVLAPFLTLSDAELNALGVRRCVADAESGYPCRVSLEDAAIGERLYLLPHVHHDVNSPYRSSGPIYVREGAQQADLEVNQVPASVRTRLLSVRAYDADGMLQDADVTEGANLEAVIERFFADAAVAYLHLHNARPGCYNCRVDRA